MYFRQDKFRVLVTQTMPNTVKDLPTLLNYVTAEEAARAKTGVHKTTNISGVRQGRHRPERDKANPRKCGICGQGLHGENNKDRPS